MKIKVPVLTEINITTIVLELAVRYGEEDIVNDFPGRVGDVWKAAVDIDTGKIQGWSVGQSNRLKMKVCDEGSYYLVDSSGSIVAKRENNYVPNGIVPGEYGDYVDLKIDEQGIITNWPKKPDVSAFFESEA